MSAAGFLRPPVFQDAGLTESARTFHQVAWLTAGVVTALLVAVGISQPSIFPRALLSIVVVDVMVVATLLVNRLGRPRLASWLYLAVIIGLITYSALSAGGIRSPGIQAWFIFVMLAGLMLGHRSALAVAAVCVVLGLGLVVAEETGAVAPQGVQYDPLALWLLISMYIGIALLTLFAATAKVQKALAEAQTELRERQVAEAKLDRALDAGRIGTFDLDLHGGRFSADERALRLTGLEAAPDGTVRLDDWLARVHPEDRDDVVAEIQRMSEGAPSGRTRYRLDHAERGWRHLEAAANLTTGPDGAPASLLGMIIDVTEREHSAQERERLVKDLGERVKELRLLHDAARLLQQASAVDRFLLADLVKRIPTAWLHASDACARITYRDIEVTSAGWQQTPWQQAASFTTSDGPGCIEVGYRTEHSPQDEGPFLAEERALLDSLAELLRAHAEQQVVQQQRKGLESQLRQAQRLDALGTLAGGIAHDFNNILTAIGGHAQLAQLEAGEGGPLSESLDEILRAHARARDLVRRILLFSRQEETGSREAVRLSSIVDEVVELLRASFPANVEIRVHVDAEVPSVLADGTQLHQVLMNLGTNAGYAMKSSGGTLSITIDEITVRDEATSPSADLRPGRHVRMSVRDTGTGMSREVMERLFEPFFSTKGQAGTGLGLSVVHGIVRDHEGAITVSSEPGVGTEFVTYLPAVLDEAETVAAPERPVRGTGQHVMYVDDEPSLTLVMSRTLRHLGYRCSEFTSADAALHEFRTSPHSFDTIVSDLQMPGMTGLELIRAARRIRPDLPAAIASGYSALASDADDEEIEWLPKPATLVELSKVVSRLTDGR